MYFGKNIKHLRKLHKVNQHEVGDVVGVNHTQIGAYEMGKSKPSYDALLAIAKFFDVSIDDLIYKDMSNQHYSMNPFPGSLVEESSAAYMNMETMITLFQHRIRELENYILDNCAEGAARVGIKKPVK